MRGTRVAQHNAWHTIRASFVRVKLKLHTGEEKLSWPVGGGASGKGWPTGRAGPQAPEIALGPGAAAAARSRPTWPLGAARARGGHGHARQPGGGEPPRARAAACVR